MHWNGYGMCTGIDEKIRTPYPSLIEMRASLLMKQDYLLSLLERGE